MRQVLCIQAARKTRDSAFLLLVACSSRLHQAARWLSQAKTHCQQMDREDRQPFSLPSRGSSSSEFGNELRNICELMNQDAQRVLKRKDVHPELRSTLESLLRHWNGLTLFLLHEKLPLDNNASERALRNPVVGRKNYYGNRAIWSGHLAAMLFSIFATLSKHKINHRQYMLDYLTACAQNRGSPPIDIEPFLPWNYSKNSLNQCASMVY